MSEIKLHITIKDGHLMAIGSQGCDTATMTTNNINRLTIKKIVSFMEFYINQTVDLHEKVDANKKVKR